MDFQQIVIPAALIIGGGALIYTQCLSGSKPVQTSKKGGEKSVQTSPRPTVGKSNTKKNEEEEEYNPDDFLTPKQLKELKAKEQRAAAEAKSQAEAKAKKAKEEQRRIQAAQKREQLEKEQQTQQPQQSQTQNTKGKKAQGESPKMSAAEQKALSDKKKAEKDQRKKEQKQRQAEIEKQLEKKLQAQQLSAGKNLTAKQLERAQKDKELLAAMEDSEWTPVMTKAQKQRRKELLYAESDSDIETISSSRSPRGNNDDDESIDEITGTPVPAVEEKVKVMVPVPVDKRHIIVGPGGATVEAIRAKTGCWISIPKDEDIKKDLARMYNQAPVYVACEGTKDGTAKAKKIILQLVEKGFSTALSGNTIEAKFQVEPAKRAAIIGPKGAYMDTIQKSLSVKIVMPDRLSRDTTVLIFGERDQVNSCKRTLQQLVEQGFSPVTHPTWEKQSIEFPAASRYRLIGRAGQTIKQLQANTRCKLSFPASDTQDIVHIIGDKHQVPLAIKAVNKIIQQMQFDEEAAAVAALHQDGEEIDEDLMQYMYIPDEEEEEEY